MHLPLLRCRSARFGFVSLANNHSLDFTEAGLLETMEVLQREGIAFAGRRLEKVLAGGQDAVWWGLGQRRRCGARAKACMYSSGRRNVQLCSLFLLRCGMLPLQGLGLKKRQSGRRL